MLSKSKHTPGPWKAIQAINQMCSNDTTVVSLDYGQGHPWWVFSPAEQHGDAEATARLIAAAPELLEALKMVLEIGLADEDGAGQVEASIYAAIVKATRNPKATDQ